MMPEKLLPDYDHCHGRGTVIRAWPARGSLSPRAAWLGPALLAAAVTGYLSWGAWVSAADRRWLYLTQVWWRSGLRPGNISVPLVMVALWLVALFCYWWPRRLRSRAVGLITVVTMVLIGAVLTVSALTPCRGGQSESAVVGW